MSTASSSTSQNTVRRNCFFFKLTASSTLVSIASSFLSFLGEVGGQQELIDGYASSSSLQPGDVKDGVAPKYFCGKYAICYMSNTDTNRNRLFFGCPLLKVTEAHCKFFLWVDEHIVRVRAGEATRGSGDGKQNHVEEHLGMDNLIAHVEERIVNLEKLLNKKSIEAELRKKTSEAATREKEASSTKYND
ncbi:hypothetical protein Ahy_A03g012134 [Arachis hypogaea]|uniref:Zinc finger GRF-type domain-containing protein n=1 Tax=Arachis hypogaea TaxID=3818 RepID=A0A445DSK9_ARAHY|nr:hypothetical protein Ahy_A03g012134 [Arachis hypogaea]